MKKLIRLVSFVLVFSFAIVLPVHAETVVEPRGSKFFAAHDTFLYKTGATEFQVWFDVTANAAIMEQLGVSCIDVDVSADGVNWTVAKTYTMQEYYSQMICENTVSHTGYVTYTDAIPGYYYRAYITFYAKNSYGIGELFRYAPAIQM